MIFRLAISIFLTIGLCSNSIGQSLNDSVFVFVGEKVSIKKIRQPNLSKGQIHLYSKYRLKFKVIQNVHNVLEQKRIVFYADAHLGLRELPTNKHSLLFLVLENGQYKLIRFQFFDVYKTTDGRWVSCGDPFYLDKKFKDSIKSVIQIVKPVFSRPVTFKINPSMDSASVKDVFREPYFKVDGKVATGVMGCYVEDLFTLKKEGILKELGFFK